MEIGDGHYDLVGLERVLVVLTVRLLIGSSQLIGVTIVTFEQDSRN